MEPLPLDHGHDSKVLRSWAKRTGHISTYVSGESANSDMESVNNKITERNTVNPSMKHHHRVDKKRLNLDQEQARSTNKTSGFVPEQQIPSFPPHPSSSSSSSSYNNPRSNITVLSTVLPPPPLPPSRSNTSASIIPPPPPPPFHLRPASVVAHPLHPNSSLSPPDPSSLKLRPESIAEENKSSDTPVVGPYHHLNGSHKHYHSKIDSPDSEIELSSSNCTRDHVSPNDSKLDITGNPGVVSSTLYGLQHYLSMVGSIVLIPLIIVPAMGGSDEDTAGVVSSVLMVTGIATLMNTYLGSRLPLVQGPSFVYLAPALAIINATEFQRIGTDRFRHTMREIQGAVIVASAFQMLLGYSGMMSFLLRLVNPVVVTATVAAVGLAFFTYGFPVIGSCLEIGLPQILVVLMFALYLRRRLVFGYRIFQVYAIPLGLVIVWAYAFILTSAGVYTYNGCSVHVPVSNIISEACRKHAFTMMHCRTDVSTALNTMPWFRFPYPFQWGMPTFQWKTISVMMVASVIASIDSIGSYHASSLLVETRAPTPGIVGRAIGVEGLNSILAGLWGIGTGVTTLTENVHTIAVTKIGNRKAIQCGACILMVASVFGKISALIASIPQVIVAALLSVTWIMVTALGLSNMRYSDTGRSRNVIIVGSSIFLSLSIPVYFQQYAGGPTPTTTANVFQPYTVAAHGPIRTGFVGKLSVLVHLTHLWPSSMSTNLAGIDPHTRGLNTVFPHNQLDFFLNTTLSMNMAIAFLVAFFLDNTVEGNQEERGTYPWSKPSILLSDIAAVKVYSLPHRLGKLFSWAKCVGL